MRVACITVPVGTTGMKELEYLWGMYLWQLFAFLLRRFHARVWPKDADVCVAQLAFTPVTQNPKIYIYSNSRRAVTPICSALILFGRSLTAQLGRGTSCANTVQQCTEAPHKACDHSAQIVFQVGTSNTEGLYMGF